MDALRLWSRVPNRPGNPLLATPPADASTASEGRMDELHCAASPFGRRREPDVEGVPTSHFGPWPPVHTLNVSSAPDRPALGASTAKWLCSICSFSLDSASSPLNAGAFDVVVQQIPQPLLGQSTCYLGWSPPAEIRAARYPASSPSPAGADGNEAGHDLVFVQAHNTTQAKGTAQSRQACSDGHCGHRARQHTTAAVRGVMNRSTSL